MPDQTNPKDMVGVKKAPLSLVPPSLVIEVSDAMANGAGKYGAYNFRDSSIKMSIYLEAIMRHLYAYMDGEENAEDSGCSHLAHMGACIAILIDARAEGNLIDDRPTKGPAAQMLLDRDKTGVKDENVS